MIRSTNHLGSRLSSILRTLVIWNTFQDLGNHFFCDVVRESIAQEQMPPKESLTCEFSDLDHKIPRL